MAGILSLSLFLSFLVSLFATIVTGQNAFVTYGNGATSERSLPICPSPRSACNIVHKRFWMSLMVKRLCKCPDRSECPTTWTDQNKYTIRLNSRAQLKFCGQVGDLTNCSSTDIALVTESQNNTGSLMHSTEVNCYCPNMHYFDRLYFNVSDIPDGNPIRKEFYKCLPFQSCTAWEFCGHITANLYETYHACRCPHKHICVMATRQTIHILEPLYEGPAYRGLCIPYNP